MITLRLVTLIAFLFFASNVWSKSEKESATWQDGYDAIYSTKTWGLAKPRKYRFSVSPQGDVTLNMGKAKHVFFKDGKLLKSNRPDQIPSQMTKICEQSFGTRLHSIKTKPKKFVMDWHYPSIVTAKCISREKYRLTYTKERILNPNQAMTTPLSDSTERKDEHQILGTKSSFISGRYEVLSDIKVNNLQVRHLRSMD